MLHEVVADSQDLCVCECQGLHHVRLHLCHVLQHPGNASHHRACCLVHQPLVPLLRSHHDRRGSHFEERAQSWQRSCWTWRLFVSSPSPAHIQTHITYKRAPRTNAHHSYSLDTSSKERPARPRDIPYAITFWGVGFLWNMCVEGSCRICIQSNLSFLLSISSIILLDRVPCMARARARRRRRRRLYAFMPLCLYAFMLA